MTKVPLTLVALRAADLPAVRLALTIQMGGWGCGNLPDSVLVFSELVTNAVVHAGGATRIVVSHGDQTLRFEVHDAQRHGPCARAPLAERGGHGLGIVANLSEAWGWDQTSTGKIVWSCVLCGPARSNPARPGMPAIG